MAGSSIIKDMKKTGGFMKAKRILAALLSVSMIIGGTSLVVYPASYLVHDFRGKYLVVINYDATPQDAYADLVIREKIGKVLSEVQVK